MTENLNYSANRTDLFITDSELSSRETKGDWPLLEVIARRHGLADAETMTLKYGRNLAGVELI
jgi:hypothetical protein